MSTHPNQHPPNQPDPLAVALSKIDPTPHGFDWNSLMFAAGRESKARALVFWRVAAGACAALALGFAALLVFRPAPQPVERIVYLPSPVPIPPQANAPARPAPGAVKEPAEPWIESPAPEPGAAARWLSVRNELIAVGLSALPDPGPNPPAPPREPER